MHVFGNQKGANSLDYIACWFKKSTDFIENSNSKYAFVSTNSICQGEQVALLWKEIFDKKQEIAFAYQPFKWQNSAKNNAAVIVVIVGVRNNCKENKYLFFDGFKNSVDNINPYLSTGDTSFIYRQTKSLANLPMMSVGNMPLDGGHFIFDEADYSKLSEYEKNSKYLFKFVGAQEFLQGKKRWTLWIEDENLNDALSFEFVRERVEKVKQFRLSSSREATSDLAQAPHKYGFISRKRGHMVIIPKVSSERREYIPISYLDESHVVSDLVFCIYDAPAWLISLLSSSMHMAWVRAVAGRLKSDYRYSSAICYNTFPVPPLSEADKNILSEMAIALLSEREYYSEKTLAQLYDPTKMPESLKAIHLKINKIVDSIYSNTPLDSEEKRLNYLFQMYPLMTGGQDA